MLNPSVGLVFFVRKLRLRRGQEHSILIQNRPYIARATARALGEKRKLHLIDPFRADEDSASRQDSGRRQRLATRQRTKMLTPYKTSDKDFDIGQKYMKPPVFVCRHQKRTNLRHATRTRNTIGVLKARNLTDRCTKTPSLSSHFAKSTNKTWPPPSFDVRPRMRARPSRPHGHPSMSPPPRPASPSQAPPTVT
jgi:hypothetical protein